MIDMQIRYYKQPVLDSLSDFEKGRHKGRYEGLLLARKEIVKWAENYKKKSESD